MKIPIALMISLLVVLGLSGCEPVNKADIIKEIIDTNYVGDTSRLVYNTKDYSELVASLGDEYSVYLSPVEYNKLLSSNSGEYTGIGLQFYTEKGEKEAKIIRVYKDSPAEEAGIELGDTLLEVNGNRVGKDNLNITTPISNVKVRRNGEELYFKVPSENIKVNRVDAHLLGSKSNVGYIKIWDFEGNVYNQFKGAIKELKKRGAESLIVDVRDNPGGDLKNTLKIVDELVPEGKMLILNAKSGVVDDLSKYIESNPDFISMAIAVLVNNNTASSAEILAGNLRYYRNSLLIGENTYGKGTVQTIFPLSDGSAVKLTVAEYSLPDGEKINHVGLKPDVEIEDTDNSGYDTALNRAVHILEGKG